MNLDSRIARLSASPFPRLEILAARFVATGNVPAKIGLIPGSFDPPTVGHVALAEALRAQGCEAVLLIWSARTLPKDPTQRIEQELLDVETRIEAMSAITSERGWLGVALSSHGLYVDQVKAAAAEFPEQELVLGVGSDKLLQIADPVWYDDYEGSLESLFAMATLAYAHRGPQTPSLDSALELLGRWSDRIVELDLRGYEGVASRSIRAEMRQGRIPRDLLPDETVAIVAGALNREK